jgi:hypothetical protein
MLPRALVPVFLVVSSRIRISSEEREKKKKKEEGREGYIEY